MLMVFILLGFFVFMGVMQMVDMHITSKRKDKNDRGGEL